MAWRVIAAALISAIVLAAGGCGGTRTLAGCPEYPRQEPFKYAPMEIHPGRPSPQAQAPLPALPRFEPLKNTLPEHEPAWQVTGYERPWKWIVIHHSATDKGSAAAFDAWHRNGRNWDELGYHFVVGNGGGSGDGLVEIGSRWPKQKHGAHCRVGDDQRYNEFGVGICLVGNFSKSRPSEAQMRSVARLVAYLAVKYRIPESNIIGHGDVDKTDCPGRLFPMAELRRRVAALRAGTERLARAP